MTSLTEAEFIERSWAHLPALVGLAASRGLRRDAAEEVVHDTLSDLFIRRGCENYRGEASLTTYLSECVKHTASRYIRRKGRDNWRRAVLHSLGEDWIDHKPLRGDTSWRPKWGETEGGNANEQGRGPKSGTLKPLRHPSLEYEATLDAQETLEIQVAVRRALACLPGEIQSVLKRLHEDGHSLRAVAADLNLATSQVTTLLKPHYETLRIQLQGFAPVPCRRPHALRTRVRPVAHDAADANRMRKELETAVATR